MTPRLLLVLATLLALPQIASAKSERTVHYAKDKVWPTAIRHLAVEEGHDIVAKDQDVGYVKFKVKDDGKEYQGALELIEGVDSQDKPVVRLVLRIEDRPTYMESGILTRMVEKLERERRSDRRGPPKTGGDDDKATGDGA
jgi:hypothetical protein